MSTELTPLTGSLTELDLETHFKTEDGDHDRFSHYAYKEDIMESMINGIPIIALCGKVWIPSRDPEKFPVCPTCKELYDMLPSSNIAS